MTVLGLGPVLGLAASAATASKALRLVHNNSASRDESITFSSRAQFTRGLISRPRPLTRSILALALALALSMKTVVIGAGQAGLSVGHHLARLGEQFVILEANARVGDTWRQRWDSLR